MEKKTWIQLLFLIPFAILATISFTASFFPTAVHQEVMAAPQGVSSPFHLEPNKVYQAAVYTSCFHGSNYSARLEVVEMAAGRVVASRAGELEEKNPRVSCHSNFLVGEFHVDTAGNYTVRWSFSDEVFNHAPALTVEEHWISFWTTVEFEVVGLFGGIGAWVAIDWIFERLGRGPVSAEGDELGL